MDYLACQRLIFITPSQVVSMRYVLAIAVSFLVFWASLVGLWFVVSAFFSKPNVSGHLKPRYSRKIRTRLIFLSVLLFPLGLWVFDQDQREQIDGSLVSAIVGLGLWVKGQDQGAASDEEQLP
ncbi:MAG: hypothetical protein AAFX06_16635 [Planctomycetota bacterium]